MKLYGKHIFRSILKNPLQPILIILVIAISTAVSVLAVKLPIKLNDERRNTRGENNYISDISINLSSESDIRIMLGEDAKDVIKDEGEVIGEFRLTAVIAEPCADELISVSATDLLSADKFYKFKFTSYGRITDKTLPSVAVISYSTAEKYGLSVGDIISVKLAGETFDMTVEAIALDEGILAECAVMIDISAVRDALSKNNPVISSLSDNFLPYTNLRIKLFDKEKTEHFISLLSSDERFSDKVIVNEALEAGDESYLDILTVVSVVFASALIIILSLFVISTSLILLDKKRRHDMALFALVGADPARLNLLRCFECAVYGLFGFGLCFLPLPWLMGLINELYAWEKDPITLGTEDVAVAFLAAVILVVMISLLYIAKSNRGSLSDMLYDGNSDSLPKLRFVAVFGALSAVVFLIEALIPPKHAYFPGLILLPIFVIFVYLATDAIVHALFGSAFALGKLKHPPALVYLSLKTISASFGKRHVGKLMTVIFTVVITLISTLSSATHQLSTVENMILCDKMIVGADEATDELIKKSGAAEECFRMGIYENTTVFGQFSVIAVSATPEAAEHMPSGAKPTRLPEKNEVAVASGIAAQSRLRVGDSLTVERGGESFECRISEIIPSGINLVFIDSELFGTVDNMLCVILPEGEEREGALSTVVSLAEERGAAVLDRETVFKPFLYTVDEYVTVLHYAVIAAFAISLVGVFNTALAEIEREKTERRALYVSGMGRAGMLAYEGVTFTLLLLFSLLLSSIFAMVLKEIVDTALVSFGVDIFY